GTHKSAIEPYTRTGFSPEAKTQQQRLTRQLWDAYLDRLTALSGVTRSTFEGWANDRGILRPADVERSGFAQTLAYADFLDKMREKAGLHEQVPETFSQIALRRYIAAEKQSAPDRENGKIGEVAVVFIEGIIANEDGNALTDGERIARQIREVRKSGDHAAIILRVNSPGGAVYPSRIIAEEMEKTAAAMPVFVSMGQYAASGGYWVSAPGDAIHANPLTVTGSIGVFALIPNVGEAARKLGLHFERSQSSDMANLFSASEAKSPKQMQAIQEMVSNTYGDFMDLVAAHRELDRNAVGEAAEGQVWTGGEALALGLVDDADGFLALREKLRERLGVDHLRLDFKSHEAMPLTTTAFSWLQSRLPFTGLGERGEVLAELLRYRGPLSLSPVTLSF
ncbi:MAG TPA: signal peptide peptidase SppA, partial [Opitutales bacterium]|nr:signal peptide peptidase SppA [Opitutales bacterium]